ncbi:LexA family protein [Patescibacteria group bacterium]
MHKIQEKLLTRINERNIGSLTLRDIGKLINERSPQKIKHHLLQLEKNGLIKVDKKHGVIERIKGGKMNGSSSLIAIPILGYADCGDPKQFAEESPEGFLKVSNKLLNKTKGIFALRAIGNSLNRAEIGKNKDNIEDGDFVIIDYEYKKPKNNDYVLSIIDGLANLKKFIKDKVNNQIILLSKSTQDYKPIYIHASDDYLIGGKIIQVIKKPKY